MHDREIRKGMVEYCAVVCEHNDVVNGNGDLPYFKLMLQKKLEAVCLIKRVREVFADIIVDAGKFMEGGFVEKGAGHLFYFHDDNKMRRNK